MRNDLHETPSRILRSVPNSTAGKLFTLVLAKPSMQSLLVEYFNSCESFAGSSVNQLLFGLCGKGEDVGM